MLSLPCTKSRIPHFNKAMRACSSAPENNSKDGDLSTGNLKEQATKIEQVIEDNKHKLDPQAPTISDEECKYAFVSLLLVPYQLMLATMHLNLSLS